MNRTVLSGQSSPCLLYLHFVPHRPLVYQADGRSGTPLATLPIYIGSGKHTGRMKVGRIAVDQHIRACRVSLSYPTKGARPRHSSLFATPSPFLCPANMTQASQHRPHRPKAEMANIARARQPRRKPLHIGGCRQVFRRQAHEYNNKMSGCLFVYGSETCLFFLATPFSLVSKMPPKRLDTMADTDLGGDEKRVRCKTCPHGYRYVGHIVQKPNG